MNINNFKEFEGNNFFERNYKNFKNNDDIILKNFKKYSNFKILEIGCSNGWRLNELQKLYSDNKYFGIDPSTDAIKFGNENFKDISLKVATCDDMNFYDDSYFDIILVPFVFMYIDRNILLKSVYQIDRILKNGGKLIITDFYSNRQRKNNYKYIKDSFIYKQNYFEIFLSTKNYFLEKLDYFSHNTTNENEIYDNTCFYVELKKDLDNMFN